MYIQNNQLDKAEYYNKEALKLVNTHNFIDTKVDFLLYAVSINLDKGKLDLALNANKEASAIAKSIGNEYYQLRCKFSYAEILEFQKQYGAALSLYEGIIKGGKEGSIVPAELQNYYKSASNVANKKGDFEKAFRYIVEANQISDSLFVKEQKEKSQYLRIKFEAEEKEKENALLSTEVLQKQSQNRFLYAILSLFLIGMSFLIVAFMQKRKYNKLLESEVRNRTRELEDANKLLQNLNSELSEFNNILSHDLKEPLRSIVGFSEMATRELSAMNGIQKERVIEYLYYVKKGGKQLHGLIEDVSHF